jgi:hypothetical protein
LAILLLQFYKEEMTYVLLPQETLLLPVSHTSAVSCIQHTAICVCFQEIKVVTGKQIFFNHAVIIKFVAVQYTAYEWT